MGAGGGDPRRLTNNLFPDRKPSWSPDGKRIAFMSERDGNYEIYVMGTDGKNMQNLTNTRHDDIDPAWYAPPFFGFFRR